MASLTIKEQLITQIERLTPDQQKQVLDFTLGLTRPRGESGQHLIESLKQYHFDPEDLAEMQRVIEEDCERIDLDEWDKPVFPD